MKFYAKCPSCKRYRLFIRKRWYAVKNVTGGVTSQNMLCGKCYKTIKSKIESI